MEAVGQLTGGLAHDFNNLLTGMMGNMELLQMRLAQGSPGACPDRTEQAYAARR
jgi:nitrogen-specific signal transduction histidine kinase